MSAVIILGYFQRRHPLGLFPIDAGATTTDKISLFSKDLVIIGSFRFITVYLGLYALKYVEVSFTETVKSTAPAVTLLGTSTPICSYRKDPSFILKQVINNSLTLII